MKPYPLLLLGLVAPPPLHVRGAGPLDLAEAVEHSLPQLGPAVDRQCVRDAVDAICWITWDEIDHAIADAAADYRNADASTLAAVHRMASGLRGAIARHG